MVLISAHILTYRAKISESASADGLERITQLCETDVFSAEVHLWGQKQPLASPEAPRLLDRIRIACQRRHYSPRTAASYVYCLPRTYLDRHKVKWTEVEAGLKLPS